MIEASGLSKNYGAVRALRGASFSVGENEIVGLLGPNGAGKTTLMKILTGYLHPSAGQATINGRDVVDAATDVQQDLGYLPENAPVYRDMLVQEYLGLVTALREIPEARRDALISEAARRTGLVDFLARPISELSKGYRQRVGLAQAIVHRPKVLILDEPSSGLDPTQIVEIRQLIKDLARDATVFLSTHILSEVEVTCERVLIISEGEVRADARLEDLQSTRSVVAAIDGDPQEVASALREIGGVERVVHDETMGTDGSSGSAATALSGFSTFRVMGGGEDMCPRIYDAMKASTWRLAELRSEHKTLESIFRTAVAAKGEATQPGEEV